MKFFLLILSYSLSGVIVALVINRLYVYRNDLQKYRLTKPLADELELFKKLRNQETIPTKENENFFPEYGIFGITVLYPLVAFVLLIGVPYCIFSFIYSSTSDLGGVLLMIGIAYMVAAWVFYQFYWSSYVMEIDSHNFRFSKLLNYLFRKKLQRISIQSITSVDFKLIRDDRGSSMNRFYYVSISTNSGQRIKLSTQQFEAYTALRFISAFKNNPDLRDKTTFE